MKLLGIRVCEHDSNFSYFDGKNLRYFKSERLNGIKHHAYNDLYIWRDVIKDKFGDNPDTIDEIAIVLDPWLYKLITLTLMQIVQFIELTIIMLML